MCRYSQDTQIKIYNTFQLVEWWPRSQNEKTKKTKAKENNLVGIERSKNKFAPDAGLALLDLVQPHS